MKIGITERGDAGIDFSWVPFLKTVDGAVIITKQMSDAFNNLIMAAERPVIVHCTCTGWGGSWMEPNVQPMDVQIGYLKKLLDMGFPEDRVVLRVDPIIPNEEGLCRAETVLKYASHILPERFRVRFSVFDDYPHVRERMARACHSPIYTDEWSNRSDPYRYRANDTEKKAVASLLSRYPFSYEACAEDWIMHWAAHYTDIKCIGCVNGFDIRRMGLEVPRAFSENPQGRKDCHCLSCKTELLTGKKRCPNGCMYCYWHD